MALALALVLHAHQPAGNFDAVIEENYHSAYRPFLQAAAARPWLRLSLHYSGFLLDWLAEHHPGHIAQLRGLVAAERVELMGGGYFEPILAAIPSEDQQEQLLRLANTVERLVGRRPLGAWLAERVWEPELPAVLARAGVAYTLLDDAHFQAAGIEAADLHGYWKTESQGAAVNVVPSNFALRQAIPFRPEMESIEYLLQAGRQHPGALLTMGDDLEKFGAWPHTAKHVYEDGWLERFFDGLEAHTDEISTVRLGDYLGREPARGLVYLPTGSYPEMMRWAGNANWRGFLTKYREANLLHKTQWDLTRRLRLASDARPAAAPAARLEAARTALLAAECNDVYWHGWFGGLYSPHLRNVAFTRLLEADALLPDPGPRRFDLHGDGTEVIELRSPALRLVITPHDGGTIEELDLRAAHANLINSLQRRPEPYHAELQAAAYNPAHLPDIATEERPGAAAWHERLRYDPYPRSIGRLYACRAGNSFADFQHLRLSADADLAGGAYAVESLSATQATLRLGATTKRYILANDQLTLEVSLEASAGPVLLEMVFNLLAPDAEDRYVEHGGERRGLRWAGELDATPLLLHDGWRGANIRIEADEAQAWWVEPLYTVSQSEAGFESNYQGSAVAAVWPAGTTRLAVKMNFFL
ncbi:MAG TPA: alpha-amylase/4-alpha-glucanotransferase domain-containing protein [Terriglobales bacterium]|nr:alpha-amylase/4-alpha-glucanotransferase domain-containing protein [Terriglobales bacterium]